MSKHMNSMGLAVLATLVGAAWLALSAAAYAQPVPGSTTPTPNVTPEHQAVLDARKQLTTDQADLAKKNADFNALVAKKRQEFNASPDMVTATTAEKNSQTAYEAAKARVIESLRTKPEYVAAVAIRDEVRQKLKELQDGNAPADQIAAAAQACLAAETIVDKMENEAFEADAATKEAKAAVTKALTELADLRRKFEEGLKADPDYTAAKSAVDTANTAVKTDQTTVATALKAEMAAHTPPAPTGTGTGRGGRGGGRGGRGG